MFWKVSAAVIVRINKKLFLCLVHTFAKRWRTVPLRGVSWDTVDDNLPDQLIAFITEKAQSLPCLVTVFIQSLVSIVWHTRIRAWIILHCIREREKCSFKEERGVRHKEIDIKKEERDIMRYRSRKRSEA